MHKRPLLQGMRNAGFFLWPSIMEKNKSLLQGMIFQNHRRVEMAVCPCLCEVRRP